MSTVQRTERAAAIVGFIAAWAASCALPAYQVEGRGETSAGGAGGRGASGSEAATNVASSGSKGGQGGADGRDGGNDPDGADGQADADAAVCTGDFARCPDLAAAGDLCPCKGNICFVDNCKLPSGGEAHGLVCKVDPNNSAQLIWTQVAEALQCCPENKRPCRSDMKEVCVVTKNPAGTVCAPNPCDQGQNVDCVCAGQLCKDQSPVCEIINGGIVVCSPMP